MFSVDIDRHVTISAAVIVPRRARGPVKHYSDKEVAQLLMDSAYTEEEISDTRMQISEMGLNPNDFSRYEPSSKGNR